jgi:nucleoside-diphosphate-sugar epimerase
MNALVIASEHSPVAVEIFNDCTGIETGLLRVLYNTFPNASKMEFAPPHQCDVYHSVGSPQKVKDTVGFTAQFSLEDGRKETVNWANKKSPLSSL